MMFNKCCGTPNVTTYSLKHIKKPIELSNELQKSLQMLLWYVPGVKSSYQSETIGFSYEIISKKLYDQFCFEYLLKLINFDANKVVCEKNPSQLSRYIKDNDPTLCINCQELILGKSSDNETKSMCLLRHVRNCLAHGRFNICGDLLIGLDYYKDECTALIKISPNKLYQALCSLDTGITRETLFKYAFENQDYKVYTYPNLPQEFVTADMLIVKCKKKYVIEIKLAKGRFIRREDIQMFVNNSRKVVEKGYIPVLIIDNAKLTKDSRSFLESQDVLIRDITDVEKLLSGEDILL